MSRRTLVRSASALLSRLLKNCGLWTLSFDFIHTINETLKWLTQLPTLLQSNSGGDSVASKVLDTKIPDPQTSPSLISLNGFCGRKAQSFQCLEGRTDGCQFGFSFIIIIITTDINKPPFLSKAHSALPIHITSSIHNTQATIAYNHV